MERERLEEIWDHDGACSRLLNDEDLLQKMLAMFLQTAEQALTDIEAATAQHDLLTVKALAHKLKGSASAVGALKIIEDAVNIETAAGNDDVNQIEINIGRLNSDMAEVQLAMSNYLREATS